LPRIARWIDPAVVRLSDWSRGVVVSQVIQPKSDGGSVEMADKMLSDITQPNWGEIDREQPRANIHRKC
jgi:hypothetical protein